MEEFISSDVYLSKLQINSFLFHIPHLFVGDRGGRETLCWFSNMSTNSSIRLLQKEKPDSPPPESGLDLLTRL